MHENRLRNQGALEEIEDKSEEGGEGGNTHYMKLLSQLKKTISRPKIGIFQIRFRDDIRPAKIQIHP